MKYDWQSPHKAVWEFECVSFFSHSPCHFSPPPSRCARSAWPWRRCRGTWRTSDARTRTAPTYSSSSSAPRQSAQPPSGTWHEPPPTGTTTNAMHITVYGFILECFTALLEGICAALILCIQALEQSRYKAGYSFEGCYFGDTMGISDGDTESLGNFSLSCFHPTRRIF